MCTSTGRGGGGGRGDVKQRLYRDKKISILPINISYKITPKLHQSEVLE